MVKVPGTKIPQQKERIVIRQRERHKISHWQGTLAVPAIAAVSLVLCATTAICAEKNYTAAFEDAFNMTMPPRGVRTTRPRKLLGTFTTWVAMTSARS